MFCLHGAPCVFSQNSGSLVRGSSPGYGLHPAGARRCPEVPVELCLGSLMYGSASWGNTSTFCLFCLKVDFSLQGRSGLTVTAVLVLLYKFTCVCVFTISPRMVNHRQ